ncbi:hypothetical protein COOONC_03340 [Cooperia oncophora]
MFLCTFVRRPFSVWKPIDDDLLPSLVEAKRNTVSLRNYVAQKTGWNMTSLGALADLADNLIEIDMYNASYPEWLLHPELPGYDSNKIISEIMEFAEMPQIACTNYAPCRDLMAGVWLQHILNTTEAAQKRSSPRIVGYASHTEVTLALMKLIGIEKEELTTSAGFVIEYRSKPAPSVRLLGHDPNPIDEHVIYKANLVPELAHKVDSNGFLLLEDFIGYVSAKVCCAGIEQVGLSSLLR